MCFLKGYFTLENDDASGPKPWEHKMQQFKTLPGQRHKKAKALIDKAMLLSPSQDATDGLQSILKLIANKSKKSVRMLIADKSMKAAKTVASEILQKHGTESDDKSKEGDDDDDDDDSSVTSNKMQEEGSTDEHFSSEEASILMLQRCAALSS